jgi:hypothetical protein
LRAAREHAMKTRNRRETVGGTWLMALVAIVLSVLGCGSSSTGETEAGAEPLVVQQVNVMGDLRTWGAEHVQVVWSKSTVRITNEGEAPLFCGVTSTEESYQPEHYFGVLPHRSRQLTVPTSPFLRCVLQWEDAAKVIGKGERDLSSLFEEPSPNTPPADDEVPLHSASMVFMPDPMPNLGVQIDDRYTLLD